MLQDRWLWAIVAVAIAFRLLTLELTDDYVPRFDAADYARHAESIASGHGFPESALAAEGGPTAFRPPAYPYALGAVFAVSGDSVAAGRIANALLGVLAVLLVYLLARRLFDVSAGRAAALFAAVFPPLVYESAALLSEPLFVVFVLAFALALLVARDSPDARRWAILAGLLCGAAALTRSNGILLLVPLAVWAATTPGPWRLRAQRGAVAALGAALLVVPWAARNTVEFGELVVGSTQTGYGLAAVYNDEARFDEDFPAGYVAPQFYGPYQSLFRQPGLDEAELDAELRDRAMDYIAGDPAYVVEVVGYNVLRLVDVIDARQEVSLKTGGNTLGKRAIDLGRYATWVVMLLAAGGSVVLTRRRAWGPAFVWLVPVLMALPAILVLAGPRYRAPADPFLCVLAGVAAVAAVAALLRRAGTPNGP